MALDIRPVTEADAEAWAALYRSYREFYSLPHDPDSVAHTWYWVITGKYGISGLVATDERMLVGLANLRWFARPSTATKGLFVDDLFTLPAARGTGIGRALLRRAAEIADEDGANVVRWVTAADNAVARRLYDGVAIATDWVTYDMSPSA